MSVSLAFTSMVNAQIAHWYSTPAIGSTLPAINMITGGIARQSNTVTIYSSTWSTIPSGSVLGAGSSFSAGINSDGGAYGQVGSTYGFYFANASHRGTIAGGAFADDATTPHVLCTHYFSLGGLYVKIWGPSLDNYGLHGARNFLWEVRDTRDGRYWSGTSETTFYVPAASDGYNSLNITITPTYYYENGDVMSQVDAP
jgi:hypothetical protein